MQTDDDAVFVAYAEEWNNYPAERVGERRYRIGFGYGKRWARADREWAYGLTAADAVAYARQHRLSPDYIEGFYAGIQSTRPVEEE